MSPSDFPWSFRGVHVQTKSCTLFVAGHDDSTNKKIPLSYAFRLEGQHWNTIKVPFVATGIACLMEPTPIVFIMGVGGWILRWEGDQITDGRIDESDDGPQNYGDLTEIRKIGDQVYVVGMCRTIYRCDGTNHWIRIDQGVRSAEDDISDAGFTSVDGFSSTDLYAVGWDGEIWHYNGSIWSQIDSPTNLILFRVVCGKDGVVYACGQNGILLCGRENNWKIIKQDETKDTFWSAIWFKKYLYLSTSNGIYKLDNGAIEKIIIQSISNLNFVAGMGFYRLDANDEVIWSSGRKMILSSQDGIRWSEPAYP